MRRRSVRPDCRSSTGHLSQTQARTTASDAAGNSVIVTVVPVFNEHGSHDDDRNGKDREKKKHKG